MVEGRVQFLPVIIANGASLAAEAILRGRLLKGIIMPTTWTAAGLTFQAAPVGSMGTPGTYLNLYDDAGTEISVTAAASHYIVFGEALAQKMAGVEFLKVRSGTASAAVAQGGERTLTLVVAVSTL